MSEPVFEVPLSAMIHTYKFGNAMGVWSCKLGGPWIGEDPSCCTDTTAPSESAARAAAVAHLESVHGIRAAGEEIDHLRAENKSLSGRLWILAQLVGGSEVLGITHLPVEEVRKVTGQVSDWEQVDDE